MKELKGKWIWVSLGIAADLFVIFFCLTPRPPQVEFHQLPLDKIFHFSVYLGLMFWFIQIFRSPQHKKIFHVLFFQGILIEIIQGLSGLRSFELLDIVANTLGVGVSYLVFKDRDHFLLRTVGGR